MRCGRRKSRSKSKPGRSLEYSQPISKLTWHASRASSDAWVSTSLRLQDAVDEALVVATILLIRYYRRVQHARVPSASIVQRSSKMAQCPLPR